MSEWWNNFTSATVKRLLASSRRFEEKEAAIDALIAGGGGIIHQASVTLTNDEIKAVSDGAAVTEIVAAPGANRQLVFLYGVGRFSKTAIYTNIDTSDADFVLFLGSSQTISTRAADGNFGTAVTFFSDVFGGGTGTLTLLFEPLKSFLADRLWLVFATADLVDKALNLSIYNGLGDLTGGHPNNSLTISVIYLIVDTTTGAFV